ncbi:unnamed protein product [Brachionus calyciflorus]|uniref:BTB domain-containing protein n=1 Tax=Brachionus calyciflorus TaxID=104777 RepID=A0A813ZFT0_9BILA|nr:unnamed protein product [Brachionus calyciflorus]
MSSAKRKRECKKHEKRPDDVLRICETCGRQFFLCDICRQAKNIEAPSSICLRCTPALKTLRNILDKKDAEIFDLQTKLRRQDIDVKTNEDLKKQIAQLKRHNEELKSQIAEYKIQIENLKETNEKVQSKFDKISDDLKTKSEFFRDIKSLLRTQEHADCFIVVNDQRFPAHKNILASRSVVLKNLIELNEKLPSPPPPPPPPIKETKSKNKKDPKNQSINESLINHSLNEFHPNPNLELKDVDPGVMPFVINFIYSGETDGISDKNVQSVMKAADVLELNSLRTSCLVFMENRLNKYTCIPMLIEAFELNHERLKKKCLKYIQEEKIELTSSSQWIQFKNENPKLALALYERYVKERSLNSGNNLINNSDLSDKGSLTTRSNNNQIQLNPIKNPLPNQPNWNSNSQNTIFSNKVSNGGKKKLIVDR